MQVIRSLMSAARTSHSPHSIAQPPWRRLPVTCKAAPTCQPPEHRHALNMQLWEFQIITRCPNGVHRPLVQPLQQTRSHRLFHPRPVPSHTSNTIPPQQSAAMPWPTQRQSRRKRVGQRTDRAQISNFIQRDADMRTSPLEDNQIKPVNQSCKSIQLHPKIPVSYTHLTLPTSVTV